MWPYDSIQFCTLRATVKHWNAALAFGVLFCFAFTICCHFYLLVYTHQVAQTYRRTSGRLLHTDWSSITVSPLKSQYRLIPLDGDIDTWCVKHLGVTVKIKSPIWCPSLFSIAVGQLCLFTQPRKSREFYKLHLFGSSYLKICVKGGNDKANVN